MGDAAANGTPTVITPTTATTSSRTTPPDDDPGNTMGRLLKKLKFSDGHSPRRCGG